ncbi:MAG: TRAP transporter substrate-binding protein, partial [Treponema sp.]|nr:TRAP transporter substrate-binding protein [Treponema sp.]
MKRFLTVLLVTFFGLSFFSGCQGSDRTILRLALTNAPDSFITSVADDFAAIVNSIPDSGLEVQVFPASQLGDQRDNVEGLRMGSLEMSLIATAAMEGFDPRFIIYSMPFLFETSAHMHRFFNSDMSQQLLDEFRQAEGIRHLGMVDSGRRQVWTDNIEISTLADFQRLTIRVPAVPIYINMFAALNANPTPMPLGDVYTGVQTGVINSFEMEIVNFNSLRMFEVLNVANITNHTYNIASLLISERVFTSLTPEQREIVTNAAAEATRRGAVRFEVYEQSLYDELESLGVRIVTLSEDVLAQIRVTLEGVAREQLGNMYDYNEFVNYVLA